MSAYSNFDYDRTILGLLRVFLLAPPAQLAKYLLEKKTSRIKIAEKSKIPFYT
jgi:hypothetical protein